jgi:hypothetical protein
MSMKPSKAYLKITMVWAEGRTMPHIFFFFFCITSYLQGIKGIASEKCVAYFHDKKETFLWSFMIALDMGSYLFL